MALNDEQHEKLKRLIKRAIEGDKWHERRYALEDAAALIDDSFMSGRYMRHRAKPHIGIEASNAVIPKYPLVGRVHDDQA